MVKSNVLLTPLTEFVPNFQNRDAAIAREQALRAGALNLHDEPEMDMVVCLRYHRSQCTTLVNSIGYNVKCFLGIKQNTCFSPTQLSNLYINELA